MEDKNILLTGELKETQEKGIFEGYASTFGNQDAVDDIVVDGAFTESLKKREPKVLYQHQIDKPIGKLLEAREDRNGLWVRVKLAINTSLGKDVYELMKDDIINRLSIGFRIVNSDPDDNNPNIRIIKKVELFEFSLVTIPANEMAKVTRVKSVPENERDFEKFLRSSGYSRNAAKAITARGIKGYQDVLREADVDIPGDDLREADGVVEALSNLLKALKGNENVRNAGDKTIS